MLVLSCVSKIQIRRIAKFHFADQQSIGEVISEKVQVLTDGICELNVKSLQNFLSCMLNDDCDGEAYSANSIARISITPPSGIVGILFAMEIASSRFAHSNK